MTIKTTREISYEFTFDEESWCYKDKKGEVLNDLKKNLLINSLEKQLKRCQQSYFDLESMIYELQEDLRIVQEEGKLATRCIHALEHQLGINAEGKAEEAALREKYPDQYKEK